MKLSKLILIACALAFTQAAEANLDPYRVEQLAANVYLLSQGNELHVQPRGNVGVVEQRSGVVLIDSGGSPASAIS